MAKLALFESRVNLIAAIIGVILFITTLGAWLVDGYLTRQTIKEHTECIDNFQQFMLKQVEMNGKFQMYIEIKEKSE